MRDLSVWPGVCWVLVSIRHTHMMGNLSLRYVPGPVREAGPQSGALHSCPVPQTTN